jgi:membrane-bound serine protease (ClpP class)
MRELAVSTVVEAVGKALMASGTNIGAASPISGSGEDIEGTLGKKVLNDAIANIRSIAEAAAAWRLGRVHGAEAARTRRARVAAGAPRDDRQEHAMVGGGRTGEVRSAGAFAWSDGAGARGGDEPAPGIPAPAVGPEHRVRAVHDRCLRADLRAPEPQLRHRHPGHPRILAFIGFGSLPLNLAGLLLLGLGVILFVLETQVVSHGLLTIGGIICFALGASALYTQPGDPTGPIVQVATPLIVVTTATTATAHGPDHDCRRAHAADGGPAGGRRQVPIGTRHVQRRSTRRDGVPRRRAVDRPGRGRASVPRDAPSASSRSTASRRRRAVNRASGRRAGLRRRPT